MTCKAHEKKKMDKTKKATDVGGNVCGDITTLGLNDRKGSKGSSTELVAHLGGTLEQTRVQVEDITGVGLTTRRTTEKEGHLTVGDGLLGQIVIDDESCKAGKYAHI
jgi:hypothetical protein